MMKSKKGIELSVNFLVTLILAIVVFGMAIYLASIIFGGGASIAERSFESFDKDIGEMACYASDNVCVNIKTETINRGNLKTLGVTVKNVLDKKQFWIMVQNNRYVDNAGQEKTLPSFTPLSLFGMDTKGRIETLDKGVKKTFGIGVEVPKNAPSGTYTLTVTVKYADPGATTPDWQPYGGNYKIFVTVP